MIESLVLGSLKVRRFRAFDHLQIQRLGRVNLITGMNNIGKSCLLEAVWLYANRGSPSKIIQLLEERDEIKYSFRSDAADLEQQMLNVKHLFHGRREIGESPEPIEIGPGDDQGHLLTIAVGWVTWTVGEGGRREARMLQSDEYDTVNSPVPAIVTQFGTQDKEFYPLDRYIERRAIKPPEKMIPIPSVFVPASGLAPLATTKLWDGVALTDREEDVLAALRTIAPTVERVTLVGEHEERGSRIPIVKLRGLDLPVPLRSMGEGMNRLLGIALALANTKNGLLLIDEIDSGLHYSVQPDLWRMVFRMANELNVQVFATTHSWDCIAALQEATSESVGEEGLLISLRKKQDEPSHVTAVLFDERELAIVTREKIEVR